MQPVADLASLWSKPLTGCGIKGRPRCVFAFKNALPATFWVVGEMPPIADRCALPKCVYYKGRRRYESNAKRPR